MWCCFSVTQGLQACKAIGAWNWLQVFQFLLPLAALTDLVCPVPKVLQSGSLNGSGSWNWCNSWYEFSFEVQTEMLFLLAKNKSFYPAPVLTVNSTAGCWLFRWLLKAWEATHHVLRLQVHRLHIWLRVGPDIGCFQGSCLKSSVYRLAMI